MGEQRQPFRFRVPWLPGPSVPTRPSPSEPTPYPVTETSVPAERIPFQPIVRPPFRLAGISQLPPPPKVSTPPRQTPQPPSPPPAGPESILPQWPTTQPEVVVRRDTVVPPPVPPLPEVSPTVVSPLQFTSGASPQTNIKSESAELTPLPSVLEPLSSTEKQGKPVPVASASLSDPVQTDQPKALPSAPLEISSSTSVSPLSPALQPRETSLPEPAERLVPDEKPSKPLASALGPSQAKADPPKPSSPELRASSPLLSENSSPTAAAAQLSHESPPKKMSLPQQFVKRVAEEKPAKLVGSTSVPNLAAANPPEPTILAPKALSSTLQDSTSNGSISRPSGESQGPFEGANPKLQEYKRVEAVEKDAAQTKAASSVTNSGKTKEKGTTHPLSMPPVPEKQPKGPSSSASSSHKPRTRKQMKFVPKKGVKMASSDQSNTHPRPSVRGISSSSSSFQKEIKDDVSKLVHSIMSRKTNSSSIQESMDVITLSGKNTGATMHLTSGSDEWKEHNHIRRIYRSNPDERVESKTDAEEEEGEAEEAEGEEDSDKSAFLNSNVQGMNNSLVLDSSVTEGSPGILFELALNAELQVGSRSEVFRDEFSVMLTEKHTYKPMIQKRCLRGQFMETSDDFSSDDADNPSKPRHDGCRFDSGWKNEEKHIDVS